MTAFAGRFEYTADPEDTIHVCTHVTIGTLTIDDTLENGQCAEGRVASIPPTQ